MSSTPRVKICSTLRHRLHGSALDALPLDPVGDKDEHRQHREDHQGGEGSSWNIFLTAKQLAVPRHEQWRPHEKRYHVRQRSQLSIAKTHPADNHFRQHQRHPCHQWERGPNPWIFCHNSQRPKHSYTNSGQADKRAMPSYLGSHTLSHRRTHWRSPAAP